MSFSSHILISSQQNPEDVVRLIENLASSNSTKNTDFERRKSAAILGKEQIDEVKAKLDSVHKLLRKHVCLVWDADAANTEDKAEVEEDVNFIRGTGFQRSGNQSANENFYGNGQRSNFNQNSQYQKPYNHNHISNNSMSYGNSS